MTQDLQPQRRKPLLVNLTWAAVLGLLIAVGYGLSYAPVVRLVNEKIHSNDTPLFHMFTMTDSSELPFYRPVDAIIDSTPLLRAPLFRWADLWGVKDDFYFGCWDRTGHEPE